MPSQPAQNDSKQQGKTPLAGSWAAKGTLAVSIGVPLVGALGMDPAAALPSTEPTSMSNPFGGSADFAAFAPSWAADSSPADSLVSESDISASDDTSFAWNPWAPTREGFDFFALREHNQPTNYVSALSANPEPDFQLAHSDPDDDYLDTLFDEPPPIPNILDEITEDEEGNPTAHDRLALASEDPSLARWDLEIAMLEAELRRFDNTETAPENTGDEHLSTLWEPASESIEVAGGGVPIPWPPQDGPQSSPPGYTPKSTNLWTPIRTPSPEGTPNIPPRLSVGSLHGNMSEDQIVVASNDLDQTVVIDLTVPDWLGIFHTPDIDLGAADSASGDWDSPAVQDVLGRWVEGT